MPATQRVTKSQETYRGSWRVFNRFGRPTAKVIEVIDCHVRKCGRNAKTGWITVGVTREVYPVTEFDKAVRDGILRKE